MSLLGFFFTGPSRAAVLRGRVEVGAPDRNGGAIDRGGTPSKPSRRHGGRHHGRQDRGHRRGGRVARATSVGWLSAVGCAMRTISLKSAIDCEVFQSQENPRSLLIPPSLSVLRRY